MGKVSLVYVFAAAQEPVFHNGPAGRCPGLIPYLILRYAGREIITDAFGTSHFIGASLMVLGGAIAASCILRFATEGKGTISPLDPTKELVLRGLYKYSRNRMYVGMMILLVGEAVFFPSLALSTYALLIFIGFNLVIILHEEPRLRRDFGAQFEEYRRRVRRWL